MVIGTVQSPMLGIQVIDDPGDVGEPTDDTVTHGHG
jgi:hypothetical protein